MSRWVHDGRPVVIPTLIARDGDDVLIHGSSASRTLRGLRDGLEACIEVTLIDGLVLARSAFHHSINYRSAILYGTLTEVADKDRALEIFTNKLIPGRWDHVRWPTRQELKGTAALALRIDEGSAQGPHRPAGRRRGGLRARRVGGRRPDPHHVRAAGARPAPARRDRDAGARHRALLSRRR